MLRVHTGARARVLHIKPRTAHGKHATPHRAAGTLRPAAPVARTSTLIVVVVHVAAPLRRRAGARRLRAACRRTATVPQTRDGLRLRRRRRARGRELHAQPRRLACEIFEFSTGVQGEFVPVSDGTNSKKNIRKKAPAVVLVGR